MARFGDVPFALAATLIGVATVLTVVTVVLLGAGAYWPVAFVVPVGLAVWFLYGYRLRPGPEPAPPPPVEEPFEDPVEEADREAMAIRAAGPTEAEARDSESPGT